MTLERVMRLLRPRILRVKLIAEEASFDLGHLSQYEGAPVSTFELL
jgi:hypothetical protein